MIKHQDRFFVDFLNEYCAQRQFTLKSLPGSWIFIIETASQHHFVMGYDLGLNSSVSAKICAEKCATFSTLDARGIAAVPHKLFLPPKRRSYLDDFGDGNWSELIKTHEAFGGATVVKQDNGTGGQNVFLAKNLEKLEACVSQIFADTHNVALSPFMPFEREVRFIILKSDILLCHEYIRPKVVGNGKSNLKTLVSAEPQLFGFPMEAENDWDAVLPPGAEYRLGWKRKVPGAEIHPVDEDTVPIARQLALDAFNALRLDFASIDTVLSKGEWKILETHSGVMLEGPFRSGRISHEKLFAAYAAALDSKLSIAPSL